MPISSPTYPDWKAPAQDGEVLVWPDRDAALAQTRENHQRLNNADSVWIQNTPLPILRSAIRKYLGHDDQRVMIATGHQTELYHAGVWVKDVLINQLAGAMDGQAFHFAVDTDGPKHLQMRWPGYSAPITDDPMISSAAWTAQLAPPTPRLIERIEQSAAGIAGQFGYSPLLLDFLQMLRRLSIEPDDLSAMLTHAQHQLDWSLGLRHHALTTSSVLHTDAFLAMVHHVMSRADEFASEYNVALNAYRRDAGIKSETRPMPDLFTSDESVEAPFWLDSLAAGTRRRPSVFRSPDGWILELVSGEEFFFDPTIDAMTAADALRKFLARTNHRIAPRALTLTMFLRLFVADQFIHGIGGGRYDQVSDRIIASHFRIAPPNFAVTTATLFFPGAVNQERVCLPCVIQQGHRITHAALGEQKRGIVEQIASAPRHSAERKEAFDAMQRLRHDAIARSSEFRKWEESLRDAEARMIQERVLFDRELFYAIQSRERLDGLIEKYKSVMS